MATKKARAEYAYLKKRYILRKKKKKNLKSNTVTITYREYKKKGKGILCSISVNPLSIPVKVSGEQIRWVFNAGGTSAMCKIQFPGSNPFAITNPSGAFGPGVMYGDDSLESNEVSGVGPGSYKYNILVYPSLPFVSDTIIVDPLVDVWDESPPGEE